MLRRDFQSKLERIELGFWCSKAELEQLAEEAMQNHGRMKKLFELLFHKEPRVQAQTARAISVISDERPARLQPFKELLIQEVAENQHWIVRASFCKAIPRLKLTARDIKQVVGILFDYLNDESSVVKTCAMQALADLTYLDTSLREDIVPAIESLTHTGTPAMRARGRMLCKQFYKTDSRRREND